MANTYHINPQTGDVSACRATQGKCPFGSSAEHYFTPEAARRGYEISMETVPAAVTTALKPAALNAEAKTTTDAGVFEQIATTGSTRTFRNLVKNPAAPGSILVRVAEKADPATRTLVLHHSAYPVSAMTPEDYKSVVEGSGGVYSDNGRRLLEDPEVDDDKFAAVNRLNIAERRRILKTPNRVSEAVIVREVEANTTLLAAALEHNRYPLDRIPNLPKDGVSWSDAHYEKRPEVLEAYATWAGRHAGNTAGGHVARALVGNEYTPPSAIARLGEAGAALEEVYKDPRATDELRAYMRRGYGDKLGSTARIHEIEEQLQGSLRDELVVTSSTRKVARAAHETEFILDKKKIEAYGLTREDVLEVMGSKGYNMQASYNEATGIFTGGVDSSD